MGLSDLAALLDARERSPQRTSKTFEIFETFADRSMGGEKNLHHPECLALQNMATTSTYTYLLTLMQVLTV